MAINVDIIKTKKHNNPLAVLRDFSRKMKTSGVLRKKRSLRYFERAKSAFRKKEDALNKIQKRKEFEYKDKMGLVTTRKRRR